MLTYNQKKRLKKKAESQAELQVLKNNYIENDEKESQIIVPDVNSLPADLAQVFARFIPDDIVQEPDKGDVMYSDEEAEEEAVLSASKQRKANRLTVAELKTIVPNPEAVDYHDVASADPLLLLHLKSLHNTLAVPAHWAAKRDYLGAQKGLGKPPFQLPTYIAATGIGAMRDVISMAHEHKSLKQTMREKVQPKMGRIDIDYSKLYQAFFKYQTKPPMTKFGEVYYEGKGFETISRDARPGELSDDLKLALSIPPLAPPPWLVAMQRYGPPPSYPFLRIPGLNAPIPLGAQWGFHPGGWGKAPVDEYNRPLYGDVYGSAEPDPELKFVVRDHWGVVEDESEEEEESEESEEDEENDEEEEEEKAIEIQENEDETIPEPPKQSTSTHSSKRPRSPEPVTTRKRMTATDAPGFSETSEALPSAPQPQAQAPSLYTILDTTKARTSHSMLATDTAYDMQGISAAPKPGQDTYRRTHGKAAGQIAARADVSSMSEAQLRQYMQDHPDEYIPDQVLKQARESTSTSKRKRPEDAKFKF